MVKTLSLFVLLASPAALACGGKACGSSCAMAHAEPAPADDVATAPGEKAALTVTGMTCGGCASKITAALKGIDGVHAASVDHSTGEAKVAYDAAKTDIDALIAAIDGLGKFKAAKKADDEA